MELTGWQNYPVTTSTPITYDLLNQLWVGWFLRNIGMGQLYWPSPDVPFPGGTDSGTVASLSQSGGDLLVTCNIGSSWGTSTEGGCGPKRWVNYTCTECFIKTIPSSYDLIIIGDLFEPRTHIRMPITDQVDPASEGATGQLTVTATAALNAVTAGYINSISDLSGKEYYIQARGYAWMSERWPERPDDQQQWRGSGSGSTGYWPADDTTDEYGVVTHNGPQYMLLTDSDSTTSWAEDKWVGLELMVYGAGGVLRRLPIVHNDAHALYLADDASSAGIGGQYSIVDVGKICDPTRKLWNYAAWAAGMADIAAGHTPDDVLTTVAVLKGGDEYPSGNPCNSNGEAACYPPLQVQFFDTHGNQVDYQVDPIDICAGGRSGKYLNRDIWKALRMLQSDIEAKCYNFIPMMAQLEGADNINAYTPATLFRDVGLPSGQTSTAFFTESTVDNGDGTSTDYGYYYFTVGGEFIGKSVRYTILDKKGKTLTWGQKASGLDGKITDILSAQYGKNPEQVGLTVIYALPWMRGRPRWVKYLYGKTSFMPDIGSFVIGGDPQVIDPPATVANDDGTIDCSLTGLWMERGPSSAGIVVSQGTPYEGEALIVGELYRYIGDNYRDPFPGGPTTGTGALLNPYDDKFYRGRLSPTNQQARDASRSGVVAKGNYFSLTQTDHNWGSDWANGGIMRAEAGNATAGNATSLTDGTKNTANNNLPHGCWWKNEKPRYATTNAYVGFILEVDKTRTLPNPDAAALAANPQSTVQQTVAFKVPINDTSNGAWGVKVEFTAFQIPKYNASNQTWTWEAFTVQAGDAYRINEPKYERDKWKDRKLTVIGVDGAAILEQVAITRSDNDTLFFAAQTQPIPAGATYRIDEMQPGVYRYMGNGVWEPATGEDTERFTVQEAFDFLPDINANNNGWVKDYGLIEYGDLMHHDVLNQIQKAIDLLKNTKGPLGWTNKSSETAEPEKNGRDARASLPYWTESAQYYADLMGYADAAGIPHDNVAYNDHDKAWERCWKAIFDINDPFHGMSEAEYTDILNGGDGTKMMNNTPPQQCGQFEDVYNYSTKYDGYYLCCGCSANPGYPCDGCQSCAFGNLTDDGNVLFSYLNMKAVESYGVVAPQRGFLRLTATIQGVIHAVIGPGDPDEGYIFPYGKDYCLNGRTFSQKNKFETAGSGAIYRKWHVYSTWSAPVGTKKAVYGPKYGSKNFLGKPETNKLPCEDITCTYTYGETTTVFSPCQVHDDYGYMGWLVDDQFTILQWDMKGY